ncbi:MAG: DUF5615 family PIN-like protein [Isosphaeraceae bacterium]
MRILADENIARDIVAWLRSGEHDVLFAAEASPGTADIRWVEIAEQEQRVILTSDKDFGELVFREGLTSHGVVLLQLDELPVPAILARLQAVWSVVEANPARRFIVITEKKGDLPGISANAGENGPRPVRRPTNPGMLAPKNGRAKKVRVRATHEPG